MALGGTGTPGALRPGDTGPAGGVVDVSGPTKPVVQGSALNFHEIQLSFSAPVDDVGVDKREIYQNDTLIQTYGDTALGHVATQLDADTPYEYFLRDYDAIGNWTNSDAVIVTTKDTYRIDSGQIIDYEVGNGIVYFAETAISGNTRYPNITAAGISNTSDPVLYQSVSLQTTSGVPLRYGFPLPVGAWQVRVHFAEWEPDYTTGDRVMSLSIQDIEVESALDIADEAGVETALIKSYAISSDGSFSLELLGTTELAFVAALEVVQELDAPVGLVASQISETSFRVTCGAVPGAVFYWWYIDGVFVSQTQNSFFTTGRAPATDYDVTVLVVDSLGLQGPLSDILVVTTLTAPTPTPYQLTVVGDLSEYLRILRYGQDPATAGAVRMENFVTFQNRGNLTRLSVAKESDENENELEDITLYSQWVVELFTDTPDGTPDYTLDSTADPSYFDLTDPDAVGVYFGRYTGNIPAGRYQATMYGVDATFTDGRQVRDTFLIDHRAAS